MRQVKIAAFLVYFLQKKQKILAICDGLWYNNNVLCERTGFLCGYDTNL